MTTLREDQDGPVRILTIDRPAARNAIDPETAEALHDAITRFDADSAASALVLTGANGNFCSGADLKAVSGRESFSHDPAGRGPLGPTRLVVNKPMIAAVEGYAVAGGLELALMCDLRVASTTAVFGVFCRRWGVPLIDGGTIRLPRVIGQSRALDMILTGRPVAADEALSFGLANRVVAAGEALAASVALARQIAAFPQACMRSDRRSALDQWSLDMPTALRQEAFLGDRSLHVDGRDGAARFASGEGRHGKF
ncbi:MAG: crotonase/enoyl-CoA hydratase family protein [Beijerinckiaceae bacterium]